MMMRKRLWMAVCLALLAALMPLGGAAEETSYVHEETFWSDHNLTGLFSSFTEYFYTDSWDVHGAELTLCMSVTPMVRPEVSDFTISINGRRFYSQRMPLTEGETRQLTIPIPVDAIIDGANAVKLEAYIRTNETEPCKDDVSKASWLTVLSNSSVAVSYTPTAPCTSIANLYERFTSIDALDNEQSAVVVRARASNTELTAAAHVLSGISSNAFRNYERIALDTDAYNYESYKYAICVSEYDVLADALKSLLTGEQRAAAEEGALMALVKPSDYTNVLILTGKDPAALVNAARMLGNDELMLQTKAAWRKVRADESVTFDWGEQKIVQPLTSSGYYLNGPFRQSQTFSVESGANRLLDTGSRVDLVFRYAENLDFNRSMVTVYVDDVPIGSKKLKKELAAGDSASFAIPTSLGVAGTFNVTVSFDLEIQDLACTLRQEEMPWAYVSADSSVTVNTLESPYLLFEYFPSPFVMDGRMNGTVFIMPDIPSSADWNAFRDVMLTLGRFLKDNSGQLRACYESGMGDLQTENAIVVGRYEKNAIAQQLNNQLFFRFSPEATTIRSNEKMLIEPNYGATLGTGQLLYNPYSDEKRALLLLTGVTDEGMSQAVQYVGLTDNVWHIAGDGYVADEEDVFFYRFKPDNKKNDSLLDRLFTQGDVPVFAMLGCGVALLLAAASVFLFIKHRRRGRA